MLWEVLHEVSAGTDQSLPCLYTPALTFRCASLLNHVLLRPVPALLLWSSAPGYQLQPALLPPLWGLHYLHPATHGRGHASRAHPQLLSAEHHGGLHGLGGGRELPALLRHPRRLPGAGQGGAAVPGHRALRCPRRAPPDQERQAKHTTKTGEED